MFSICQYIYLSLSVTVTQTLPCPCNCNTTIIAMFDHTKYMFKYHDNIYHCTVGQILGLTWPKSNPLQTH